MLKARTISKGIGGVVLGVLLTFGCGEDADEKPATQEAQPQQQQTGEISDQELQQFASAARQIQSINQDVQQEMVNVVQQEGLGIQRFNEIQQAQLNPNQEVEATREELKQYERSIQQLQTIQSQAQKEMESKIKEEGLTVERYQQIVAAIQSSPELQQKLQTLQQQQ